MLTSLKDLIFLTRSITVQIKFISLNGKLYVRDNRLLVFVNFSFSSGCDLHDRSQICQKKLSDYIRFGTSHFNRDEK